MYYSEKFILERKKVPKFINDIVEASDINACKLAPWVTEEPYRVLLALIHLPEPPKYQTLYDKYANVVLPNAGWNKKNHECHGVW